MVNSGNSDIRDDRRMCYVDSNPAAVKKLLVTPKHSYRLEPIPFILTEIFKKREKIVEFLFIWVFELIHKNYWYPKPVGLQSY